MKMCLHYNEEVARETTDRVEQYNEELRILEVGCNLSNIICQIYFVKYIAILSNILDAIFRCASISCFQVVSE